eukprot:TRINITY_DN14470_c0_g1_i1.p1 TRINITY_DN14470_c0_g1~~TRINITY_DN14470_c0_g1_i1.p1  ORF type:complete len:153 (-),score=38.49 TRINITY_DN14470_c0_g1_i1:140-598(-)
MKSVYGTGLSLLILTLSLDAAFSKAIQSPSCSKCKVPRFQGRNFYLPFCADGTREHPDICGAICDPSSTRVQKGSCSGCEKACSPVFFPVCSASQDTLYANACHARCAGVTEPVNCQGLASVLPGKTPLPLDKVPKRVQSLPSESLQSLEEE